MNFLEKTLGISKKAFTAILVGSIMAILIGSVLLIVTYVVLSSVINVVAAVFAGSTNPNSTLNASFYGNVSVITQALTIVGISLIVAGVAGIIYMLLGVSGVAGGGRR